jgi:putative membrane protein
MSAALTESETLSPNELAQERTDLALFRNLMAADRTLMAWVRTSLSLDSFGFTIYKVLVAFQQGGGQLPQGHTPRNIGLFLTGLGTVAMLMGTVEYWQSLKELQKMKEFRLTRPSLLMALLMSVMGVFLFISIMTKLF